MRTLAILLDEYAEYLTSLRYSPETIRKTRAHLHGMVDWMRVKAGIELPDDLQPEHVRRWHAHILRLRTAKGQPCKAVTINRHIISARQWLVYLAKCGLARPNLEEVLPYLREPRVLPGSVLGHEQMMELVHRVPADTTEGYRNRTMLEVLYTSGIRSAEILGLDLEHVNLKNGVMLVTGKGDKQRVVPIGRTAIRMLETYLKAVRPFLLHDTMERAVFVGKDGRRLSYMAFWRMVKACTKRASIETQVSPHTFRRSCTTELIRGGANMYHVKELLGHESLDTLKHYVKLTILDLKKTHQECHPRERQPTDE